MGDTNIVTTYSKPTQGVFKKHPKSTKKQSKETQEALRQLQQSMQPEVLKLLNQLSFKEQFKKY
jgi:restriction endonuclease S subunit